MRTSAVLSLSLFALAPAAADACDEAQCLLQWGGISVGANMGTSVDLTDGALIAGSPFSVLTEGVAHVFRWDGDVWVEEATLQASDADGSGHFGEAVVISGAEAYVGDGGADDGRVYVFRRIDGVWEEVQVIEPPVPPDTLFGFGRRIDVRGARMVVAASAAAFAYDRIDGEWVLAGALVDPGDGGSFAWDVAIDGDQAAVTAPDAAAGGETGAGRVHLYARQGAGWVHAQTIEASDPAFLAHFGRSVDILGGRLAVGAPEAPSGNHDDAGAVYVFELEAGVWGETQRLEPPFVWLLNGNDYGSDVALAPGRLVVGDEGLWANGWASGGMWHCPLSGGQYVCEADPIVGAGTDAYDELGASVSATNAFIAGGAPQYETTLGAVYVTRTGEETPWALVGTLQWLVARLVPWDDPGPYLRWDRLEPDAQDRAIAQLARTLSGLTDDRAVARTLQRAARRIDRRVDRREKRRANPRPPRGR